MSQKIVKVVDSSILSFQFSKQIFKFLIPLYRGAQMDDKNQSHLPPSPETIKASEEFPLEVSTQLGKPSEVSWRWLLSKIYENINRPPPNQKKPSTMYSEHQDDESLDNCLKCKCKKTKCLKLYCECFTRGQYCNGCNCEGCQNTSQFDPIRSITIDLIMQRNPNAFDPVERTKMVVCICKKTGCLKKYCQCYNLGQKCSGQCKCANCLNMG